MSVTVFVTYAHGVCRTWSPGMETTVWDVTGSLSDVNHPGPKTYSQFENDAGSGSWP